MKKAAGGTKHGYTLGPLIADGRFGTVYEGHDSDGTPVAVKKVSTAGPGRRSHAKLEIAALDLIRHDHVVKLFRHFEEDPVEAFDHMYRVLILELCKADLYTLMRKRGVRFSTEEVRALGRMLMLGIQAVHEAGLMHRDVKPGNLLLTAEGVLKVCDFGLATSDDAKFAPHELQVGTLWYKSIELLLGHKAYDRSVDMWACGAVLAELMSGKVLIDSKSEIIAMGKIFDVFGSEHFQDPEWKERRTYPIYGSFVWPEVEPMDLAALVNCPGPKGDKGAFSALVKGMMTYSTSARLTATAALAHPFLRDAQTSPPSTLIPKLTEQEPAPAQDL